MVYTIENTIMKCMIFCFVLFLKSPKVLQLLEDMEIKKAVVTSKTQNMALRGLKLLNLDKYIIDIIGCDQCINHKPDPEPMLKGAAALILPPEKCLCVGDSPYDLLSGRAAGCQDSSSCLVVI